MILPTRYVTQAWGEWSTVQTVGRTDAAATAAAAVRRSTQSHSAAYGSRAWTCWHVSI